MAVFGGVEADPVAVVAVPVTGLAETVAPVAVKVVAEVVAVVTPEVVAAVAFETVAESVDAEMLFAVPVGAVCRGTTDV